MHVHCILRRTGGGGGCNFCAKSKWYSGKTTWFSGKQWKNIGQETSASPNKTRNWSQTPMTALCIMTKEWHPHKKVNLDGVKFLSFSLKYLCHNLKSNFDIFCKNWLLSSHPWPNINDQCTTWSKMIMLSFPDIIFVISFFRFWEILHWIWVYIFKLTLLQYIHSTKKVSSRLTLFDITRGIFNQNCSFKM